jgi:hypothetical protein
VGRYLFLYALNRRKGGWCDWARGKNLGEVCVGPMVNVVDKTLCVGRKVA